MFFAGFGNDPLIKVLSLSKMTFNGRKIKGVLCDITGVLTESVSGGGSKAITGSVEALQRLKAAGICLQRSIDQTKTIELNHFMFCLELMISVFLFLGIPFRLVTNETQNTRQGIVDKLHKHGFDVPLEDV